MSATPPPAAVTAKDWFRSGVAGMASYLDAAAIVSTGIALVLYQEPLGLSAGQIGALSSMLTFAIAVGALVGGRLGDRYGRRRVFTVTMVLLVTGSALLAAAPNATFLYAGILLVGFASGADLPVSIALISEEAPEGAKGKLVGLSQVLWYGGILGSQLIGVLIGGMGELGARIIYGHLAVVALVVLVLRLRVPESRQWIAERSAAEEVPSAAGNASAVRRLLGDRRYLLPFLALAGFYCLSNVAANTKGQFGTYMYVNAAGSTVQIASALGLAAQIVSVGLAIVFMRVVDGPRRMRWYTIGAIGFVGEFALPAVFGVSIWSLALGNLVGTLGLAFAFEAIYKVWTQEKFPTLLRSTAQGTTIALARVLAAVVALWTPLLVEIGPEFLFASLAVLVAISMGFGYAIDRMRGRRAEGTPSAGAVETR
ncbi:MFS transporter [Saccharopolyspora cebuensis]|uniref:MFS transporter n=1 Tax=Saccharopolyspora cebuensis TaxID=418759 RepID=A0ABV4CFK6_9PSEU